MKSNTRIRRCLACVAGWSLLSAAVVVSVGCDDESHHAQELVATTTTAPADSISNYPTGRAAANTPPAASDVGTLSSSPATGVSTPPQDSCMTAECHGDFAEADYIHAPVSKASCQSCHDEDRGGHTFPLLRPGNRTCTFCHQVTGTRQYTHKAVDDPGCLACHDPHASQTPFLLNGPTVERVCAACHTIESGRYTHGPFAEGKCTACHRPHQSDAPFLLRGGEGAAHCFTCHTDLGTKLANAPVVHKPASESCVTCHTVHTSDFPHQLKASLYETCFGCHKEQAARIEAATVSHDAVFTAEQCANCHDPHAAGRPALLKDRVDRLCLNCHSQPVQTSDGRVVAAMTMPLQRKYLHGPIKSGDCTACHNAHGSAYVRLLRNKFPETFYASFDMANYALCFRCHEKGLVLDEKTTTATRFRDGEINLHYLHVHRKRRGRTCRVCHNIHGSDQPKQIAREVPFEGSSWPLHIGFEMTADGGTCTPTCHEARTYRRDQDTDDEATSPPPPPP